MSGNAFPNKFEAELRETAAKLVAPGKGILAADESTGTIGKRVRVQLMCALGVSGISRCSSTCSLSCFLATQHLEQA